ncbi:MAG TPA: DNA polymerase III subunit gamma/tau [Blastocatellia bacterium]|nr:DNA polymerase III subunit gamma/tau [Blastocatellia bacterium]
MADSQVIARKFRPQAFSQVIGQEVITRTLTNAINTGRLHHAYLFTGARGVGKTTTARILAKALNCIKGVSTEPCGECPSCVEIAGSRSIDVIEIDAASNTSVENVREVIINSITIAPARDRHKIFIIDEVHMLSGSAFNALLKTLEEPPPRVVFILATTDLHKVPETILSRCQVFEFRTISLGKILDQLRCIATTEGVSVSDRALMAIARAGEGSMRDAQSAFDQVISFAGSTIHDEDVSAALGLVDVETLNQTIESIATQDSARLLRIIDDVASRGYDIRSYCRELMTHFRGLLMIKIAGFDPELTQLSESDGETLARLAEAFSEQDLVRFFSVLTKTEQDIRVSAQPRFQLEIGLLKLLHAKRLYLLEDALNRITDLESRLGGTNTQSGATSQKKGAQFAVQRPASAPGGTVSSARGPAAPPRREPPSAPASQPSASSWTRKYDQVEKAKAPDEPPPLDDYDADFGTENEYDTVVPTTGAATDQVRQLKAELERQGKMMIVSALDKGETSIDGDYLKVSYASGDGVFKNQLEARDKRLAIEDACEKVLGRRLSLLVILGSQPAAEGITRKSAGSKQTPAAASDPKLRAIVERFHGEVIEVIKPDQQD